MKAKKGDLLPEGSTAYSVQTGWACTIVKHVHSTVEDGWGYKVRWHNSGHEGYARPGALTSTRPS